MRNHLLIIIQMLILCSCATIMNGPTQRIDIIANRQADIKTNDQVLRPNKNRTSLIVARDNKPIKLTVFNDTISKQLTLQSKNSFAYWFNIIENYGLGMLIDKDSPKRYAYPKNIYVDMTNNLNSFTTYNPVIRKGSLQLHYSLPWINNFLLNPIGENSKKFNTGFWGIMLGFDYYYKTNRFLNLSASAVMDFFIPFPAAVDFGGEWDFMSSQYISLSNNFRIKRFSIGYGLSCSKNIWDHRYYVWGDTPPPKREPIKKTDYSIGLIFPFYVQTGEHFSIGLIYRPSFLTIEPVTKFKYNHLISIDFAWKIPIVR
jgi:hypothetical protein